MDRLSAIKYVCVNARTRNEWTEAAMYCLVSDIACDEKSEWTEAELKSEIEERLEGL